jgi:hypothetical protein
MLAYLQKNIKYFLEDSQMSNVLLTCSDEMFKEITVGCMKYYRRKTHMHIKEIWDMMFGSETKFKDVLSDRKEAACCVTALIGSLTY